MLTATVLAAGASVRMGHPKALLQYEGRTFLECILEKTRTLGLRSYAALGHDSDKVLAEHDLHDVTVVMNTELSAGPIGSIRASIRALGDQAVEAMLVWPVDFPHVLVSTVKAMLEQFEQEDKPAIVVPEFVCRTGHPVLFGRQVFEELLTAPDSIGARAVVRSDPARVSRVRVDDPSVVDCINTPESYRALLSKVPKTTE